MLQDKVRKAVDLTRNNDQLILNVAFNYGGRQDLIQAIRRIVQDGIPPDQIDETLIDYYLYTAGQPDPDLVIRTAGEMRLSNFLLWQASYAEYYAHARPTGPILTGMNCSKRSASFAATALRPGPQSLGWSCLCPNMG